VTFYFENLNYVARWLLRFGAQAQVLEPEALRERVRVEALTLLQMHDSEAPAALLKDSVP
jgi:predicted DNA-binding transcriptional regulator YafY